MALLAASDWSSVDFHMFELKPWVHTPRPCRVHAPAAYQSGLLMLVTRYQYRSACAHTPHLLPDRYLLVFSRRIC